MPVDPWNPGLMTAKADVWSPLCCPQSCPWDVRGSPRSPRCYLMGVEVTATSTPATTWASRRDLVSLQLKTTVYSRYYINPDESVAIFLADPWGKRYDASVLPVCVPLPSVTFLK